MPLDTNSLASIWVVHITNNDDTPDYEISKVIGTATVDRAVMLVVREYVRKNPDRIIRNPDYIVPDTSIPFVNDDGHIQWDFVDPQASEKYTFLAQPVKVTRNPNSKFHGRVSTDMAPKRKENALPRR